MDKQTWWAGALVAGLALLGCERQSEVKDEVQELQQAERNSPQVAKELEQQLATAKSEVVKLEEKLALAKQGVTDEVVEQRKELKDALKQQEQHVREEVKEAQGAAAAHNAESQRAVDELQRTQPTQRVEAQVKTETQAIPTGERVEATREQQQIPIENSRVVERGTTTERAQPVE